MINNNIKYYIVSVMSVCGLYVITGSVMQTFMLEYGVSEQDVAFYVSFMQIVQTVTMLLISKWVENVKDVIKVNGIAVGMQALLGLALAFFCGFRNIEVPVMFWTVFAVSFATNIFYGLYAVFSYKLPYHIMDIKSYGRITSISGVFVGISGALFAALMTYATATCDYFLTMLVFFAVSTVLYAVAGVVSLKYKKVEFEESKKEKTNLFKYKPFYILIVPNFLRGFANGIVTVAAVIGGYYKITDAASGGTLLFLHQVATILGCYIYSLFSKKDKDAHVLLFSGICFVILLPMLLAGNSATVFFSVYFLICIVYNFINYGVPVAVTKMVDYRYMGQYSAWRMLLHTFGTAIGSGCVVFLLNSLGGFTTLAIAGACQLFSSVAYYVCIKKYSLNRE